MYVNWIMFTIAQFVVLGVWWWDRHATIDHLKKKFEEERESWSDREKALEQLASQQDDEIASLKAKLAQQRDENEAMIKAEVDKRWPELKAAYLDKFFSDKSDD